MDKLLRLSYKKFDFPIIIATTLIVLLGISTIQSTIIASSSPNGILNSNLINVQVLSVSLGLLLCGLIVWINFRYLAFLAIPLYIFSITILVLVLFVGDATRGSIRWIDLGIVNFQPSTFSTLLLIISFAAVFSWIKSRINHWFFLLVSVTILVPPFGLILIEPDLGMALVVGLIWFVMLHLTPIKWYWLVGLYILILGAIPFAYQNLEDYQKERLTTFLSPIDDPLGAGYNSRQSVIAVGSGQITGRGWGQGTQSHLHFLPEQHTDFIFATFAEEQGFLGSSIVLLLFAVIIWRSFLILKKCDDYFGQLLSVGVIVWFVTHILINVGMNLGIAPITGIPLPLMSYGGTAMITALSVLGLVQSVATHSYSHV